MKKNSTRCISTNTELRKNSMVTNFLPYSYPCADYMFTIGDRNVSGELRGIENGKISLRAATSSMFSVYETRLSVFKRSSSLPKLKGWRAYLYRDDRGIRYGDDDEVPFHSVGSSAAGLTDYQVGVCLFVVQATVRRKLRSCWPSLIIKDGWFYYDHVS